MIIQGFGDTLHSTLEEAKLEAELNDIIYFNRQKTTLELEKSNTQAAAKLKDRQEDVKCMSLPQIKAHDYLNKLLVLPSGEWSTWSEIVHKWITDGLVPTTQMVNTNGQ